MEREGCTSGPGDSYEERTHPQLGASGNGELEKAVKCSTGARRRGGRVSLYEEPKGEEPGEWQDTEMSHRREERGIMGLGNCVGNYKLNLIEKE